MSLFTCYKRVLWQIGLSYKLLFDFLINYYVSLNIRFFFKKKFPQKTLPLPILSVSLDLPPLLSHYFKSTLRLRFGSTIEENRDLVSSIQ